MLTDYNITLDVPVRDEDRLTPKKRVTFKNKQLKDNYVAKEAKFCYDEICEVKAAMTHSQVMKAKEKLFEKRLAFALSMGYKPHVKDHNIYVYYPRREK